jgi:hypothetical protein
MRFERKGAGKKLFDKYKVVGTPTLVIIDAKGKEYGRVEGVANPPVRFLAGLYNRMGMEDKAVKVFGDDFVTENFKDAYKLNSYAWFWGNFESANLESALRASKRSVELSNSANHWDTLSMVYWKMGESKTSKKI